MSATINYTDPAAVIDLLDRAAAHCLDERYRDRSVVRLPRRGSLLATGDLHDNPYHYEKIVGLAGLDRSPDRHLILHELIHGENYVNDMDFSHRMLLRAAELKCAHPDQAHLLLANHEMSQMTGRGVSKGAGDSAVLFNEAVEYVFGDEAGEVLSAINRFLRSWPLAVITESGFLCAHSVPSVHDLDRLDPGILQRDLTEEDFVPRTGSAYLMVWGRRHTEEHFDRLAEMFGVEAFILGHEHVEMGWKTIGRRAIVLNSDHDHAAVLPLDLACDPHPEGWEGQIVALAAVEG